ncbi:MAG TPA: heme exporter protein CcmD [Novosphingobium sp.]|nr:heme exporter protein CcmD [Novosphingobium sp.]HZV10973.1 heme exporter protein CcmD [Novosphingobium sp.]
MREAFDQWQFVIAAYAIGAAGIAALLGHSLWAMRRAERRRDSIIGRSAKRNG